MKIRLPIIWRDSEKIDQSDQDKFNSLGHYPEEEIDKSQAVIDLSEIESWFPLEETTLVNLKSGKRFEVDVPEEIFTGLYTKMTLEIIGEVQVKMEDDDERDI